MRKHSGIPQRAAMALAVSALWSGLAASAPAQAVTPEVTVTVLPEHYVLAGRTIDDLDVLERAVTSMRPRALGIYACGSGTARAQKAAAHRFRDLYLELRVLEADSASCRAAAGPRAMPVGQRVGPRPSGIDDEAVDRWWYHLMP